MIYSTLATYYDDLVKDEQATQAWVTWIERHKSACSMLECACGSGEITHALALKGYTMQALDLSQQMIDQAKAKDPTIPYYCQDMKVLSALGSFEAIACLCDSFNYLLDPEDVITFFQQVHDHLHPHGTFFFDTHALDRLAEFRQEWNETGEFCDGTKYQWSIESEDDWIYQDFAFYTKAGLIQEHHLQRVYDPQWLKTQLEPYFEIESIDTDFTHPGICPGEKYFYVCTRKETK